jgi:hypothetical protein
MAPPCVYFGGDCEVVVRKKKIADGAKVLPIVNYTDVARMTVRELRNGAYTNAYTRVVIPITTTELECAKQATTGLKPVLQSRLKALRSEERQR